jgi:hypothetical protein
MFGVDQIILSKSRTYPLFLDTKFHVECVVSRKCGEFGQETPWEVP